MPSDFERVFSDLAYAFLQQSGLDVSRYLIGFEIVDKNESQTRGVGFFALKIGDKYYYVPVFFNNGEIKSLIMMYDKNGDMFLPLNQEWVDFLEKSTHPTVGESSPLPEPAGTPVNIRNFMGAPFGNRLASDKNLRLSEFLKTANFDTKQAFLKNLKDNKDFLKAINSTYGIEQIKKACEFRPQVKGVKPDVVVFDEMEHMHDLTPAEKLQFMKKGYAVRDERDPDKIIASYDLEYKGHKCSPKETGVYEVLTDRGKRRCLVVVDPYSLAHSLARPKVLVIDVETGSSDELPRNEMVVYDSEEHPFDAVPKLSLTDIDKMQPNQRYVMIEVRDSGKEGDMNNLGSGNAGTVTEPFEVERKTKGVDGNVYYTVDELSVDEVTLIIKESGTLSRVGKDYIVPRDRYKAFKLNQNREGIRVVGRPHLEEKVCDEYVQTKVASEALFMDGRFVKKLGSTRDAEMCLIKECGLSLADAEKYATGGVFWTKRAFNPMFGGLGTALATDDAPGGVTEPEYLSYSGEDKMPRTDLVASSDNIKREISKAVGLSEMGMKDVFDKAMIGVLSKLTDITSELRSYVPDLMKGLDKVARTLFIFWYRGDKIKDRFTLNEFSETEDLLKDTFNNLGSIILDLKKKYLQAE